MYRETVLGSGFPNFGNFLICILDGSVDPKIQRDVQHKQALRMVRPLVVS